MANQYFTCELHASVSGTNVSAYMRYYRSGSYFYQDEAFPAPTMTIDGTNYSDTGFQNRVHSGLYIGDVSTTTYTKSCANGNRTVTFSAGSGYRSDFSGTWSKTVNVNASSPPTGLSVSLTGRTWNSATATVSVSSYGQPSSVSGRHIEFGVMPSSNTAYGNPYRYATASNTTSSSITVNNSSNHGSTVITLRGCYAFKIGGYATNTSQSTSTLNSTVYYLPPSPLTALSVASQTYVNNTTTKVKLNITGGNSTNNEDVTVTTEYRYQVNSDSWSAWTSAGTGKPWDTKSPEVNLTAGASVNVQARQVYQSQYSETKSLAFTVYQRPQGVTVTAGTITKNTVQAIVKKTSSGKPTPTSPSLQAGIFLVNSGAYNTTPRRLKRQANAADNTNYTLTLSSTSEALSGATFLIEPNSQYYLGVYCGNSLTGWATQTGDDSGQASNYVSVITSPETTETSLNSLTVVTSTGTVTANIEATLLGLGGGVSSLTPKYRYSTDGGTTWSSWTSLSADTIDQNFDITGLPFNTLITVESKTTGVRDSTVSTMTFRTGPEPVLIDSFDWSFDELRRQTITWKLRIKSGYTVAKNAVLTIKSHNVILMNNSTALSSDTNESLPAIYKPNETLAWSLTVSTTGITQTITGEITMPRPILGLIIGPDGVKKYITDMVKAGGSVSSDDFLFDVRYDKFKVR